MENDLKVHDRELEKILAAPFSHVLGCSWNLNRDLRVKGSIKAAAGVHCLQRFYYNKSNVYVKAGVDSNKIYKLTCQLQKAKSSHIVPSLDIVLNYLLDDFSHVFSAAYTENNKKVVFGLRNTDVFLYYIQNFKNFGLAGQLSIPLDNVLQAKYKLACWWCTDRKKIILKKQENNIITGTCYYKNDTSTEIAGKIILQQKNIQMLLGLKYHLNPSQVFKIRLNSEGTIGVNLASALSNWATLETYSEISVKELAQNNKTFLGFGLHFTFTS